MQHVRGARSPLVSWMDGKHALVAFRAALDGLVPYQPGRPVELVRRELGLTGPVVKLASNEGQYGPFPAALEAIARAAAEGNRYPDGGCYALRAALAERHGLDRRPGRGRQRRRRRAQLPRARDARARRRGRVLLAVVPGVPDQRGQDGRRLACARRSRAARYDLDALAAGDHAAHEDRLRHEPEQPDRRMVAARGARPLPRRAARARAAGDRRGLHRVRRRSRLPRRRCASTCSKAAACVVLRTFSKIYGLAGLRVGWGAMPLDVAAALEQGQERVRREPAGAGRRAARASARSARSRAARRDPRRARAADRRPRRARPRAAPGGRELRRRSMSATAPRSPPRSSGSA